MWFAHVAKLCFELTSWRGPSRYTEARGSELALKKCFPLLENERPWCPRLFYRPGFRVQAIAHLQYRKWHIAQSPCTAFRFEVVGGVLDPASAVKTVQRAPQIWSTSRKNDAARFTTVGRRGYFLGMRLAPHCLPIGIPLERCPSVRSQGGGIFDTVRRAWWAQSQMTHPARPWPSDAFFSRHWWALTWSD